jgi:hypothetical protein
MPFYWNGALPEVVSQSGISDYAADHKWSIDPLTGIFHFDNGHGFHTDSTSDRNIMVTRKVTKFSIVWQILVEDLFMGRTDFDGNDFKLTLKTFLFPDTDPHEPAPVPEPATMFMIGTGMLAVARAVRKKRKAHV